MKLYHIIYETTNLINGKKYRGAHSTQNINDGYRGSGKLLKDAIRKYGKESFHTEILFVAFDYDALYWAESIFVDQSWIDSENTYNLSLGGRGSTGNKGRVTSVQTKQLLSEKVRNRLSNPEYRQKLSIAQQNRQPTTEQTKAKMRQASLGKSKSYQHSQNISKGMKARFEDPSARMQRSTQAKITNNRPEVKAKISQALKGKKRSIETRARLAESAQKRCQNQEYLAKQSSAQSERWKTNPAIWWNNGVKNQRSVDAPGPDFVQGRISFGTWWTNGVQSVMSKDSPGPEWVPGRGLKLV